ncbi:MAG: hypothetical protein Q8Q73_03995 [Stagnimonas sp.]|nr:hypothetical protein [Stagnimonas sp.]
MNCRKPLRALCGLALVLLSLPAPAAESLLNVAAGFQAEAVKGQVGAARPLRVALSAGEEVSGSAEVQALGDARCRSIIELVYDRPYEQRGVLITGLKRRSVQEGACARLAAFMTEQAQREAAAIQAQVQAAGTPAAPVAKAQPVLARRAETSRPAPPRVVSATAQSLASYQLTVLRRAVVRDSPSFNGVRRAMLPAGQIRLGRMVPGREGWYEILDLANGLPAYIHESVVAQGPAAGRA